ncbi:DUF5958 family protein [Streptomyces viridosporus]
MLLGPVSTRSGVLQEVPGHAVRAHITAADGRAGVARSGGKPTANPSVMIRMDPPRHGFAGLPPPGRCGAHKSARTEWAP